MKPPAAQTLIEVPLNNGTSWRGTEVQLRRDHPNWLPYAQVVQSTIDVDQIEDGYFNTRLPSSARRYAPNVELQERVLKSPIPPRRSAAQSARETEDAPRNRQPNLNKNNATSPVQKKRGWFRAHPLLWLGLGMLVMLGLWQGLTALGNWWQVHQDDATYGRPRTAQYDVQVGHNDSSTRKTHIIVMNLNAKIVIIELPGGDSSKAKIYQGPQIYGSNANLDPITAGFFDVDEDGKVDMVIYVQGTEIIFLNQNGQFVQQQSH